MRKKCARIREVAEEEEVWGGRPEGVSEEESVEIAREKGGDLCV